MSSKKNVSSLSQHVLHKGKGIVATPLNNGLGDILQANSWTQERMPEYLWLGLILLRYGRREGLEKSGRILSEIAKNITSLPFPKISKILHLPDDVQKKVYEIISKYIKKVVLSPLTVLYKKGSYPIFNSYFYVPQLRIEDRIRILSEAIKIYSPPQSDEATDLRYLAVSLLLFSGRLHINRSLEIAIKALTEYPYTEHDDEKMRAYRPTVRSLEGMSFPDEKAHSNYEFWRDIGMITPCNPMVIKFDGDMEDHDEFIGECRKVLEYILSANKEKSLLDEKFDVIIGSISYALKIFDEIREKALGNSILGRHGLRTIIEIYIILKYLLKREAGKPNIWEEYKLYGISKYKLVLLKAREAKLDKSSHFMEPIVDALVNEIKWEEIIDIDLKYFDKQGIREKSIEVGEKELYDLFYDYDSSFSHGLWGSIRESAMLHCNNAAHQYHSVPDIYSSQELPNVNPDTIEIMKKLFSLLSEIYGIPKWFLDKYRIFK